MTFPVQFHIFGRPVPAHMVFELLAYIVGVQTYLLLRRREPRSQVEATLWIIVCCVFGALIGSKVLAWLELSPEDLAAVTDWRMLLGGKTIVGGLIGGWAGVEIGKRIFGITSRTGDAYVLPLVLGIAIGRVGCFLTGLPDHTYGIATSLPWGVDFGDGISRHPTQLYEIAFVLLWGASVWLISRSSFRLHPSSFPIRAGDVFRLFMLGYFGFRFLVEFIKPVYRPSGLSSIQWASLIAIGVCVYGLLTHPREIANREVQRVIE